MNKFYSCFAIITLWAGVQNLNAQQLPLFSEYLHNAFTLNPALMGWENITAAGLSYRQQWTGMNNAPARLR